MRSNLAFLSSFAALLFTVPLAAQKPLGEEVARFGSSVVYLAQDADIPGSGSRAIRPLRYAWYMVQDSTLRLTWDEPSGIKLTRTDVFSSDWRFDGDIDLRALEPARAVEVRALIFNVWRERLRTLQMTDIKNWEEGQKHSFSPNWYDLSNDAAGFATSLIYVSKVMLGDGTILEADLAPVLEFAQTINESLSAEDLLPDPDRNR